MGKRVKIVNNNIYNNGGLGIDLGTTGITANDLGDPDDGANGLLKMPVIQRVYRSGTTYRAVVNVNSKPNANYTLRFYGNTQCDTKLRYAGQVVDA